MKMILNGLHKQQKFLIKVFYTLCKQSLNNLLKKIELLIKVK